MADSTNDERILYGFWLSPYMSIVAQLMLESGLKFTYERVSPYRGSTHSDVHKARNPLGKIPSLVDVNGVVVSESQAICRYLARTYAEARGFYPCDDPARCAAVDEVNDFITFSIGGPFFNWFVVTGYMPNAFGMKTEQESQVFGAFSTLMLRDALTRLLGRAKLDPYLLGAEPTLPDLHLFHTLETSRTFSRLFDIPMMNLVAIDPALAAFYDAMCERPATQQVLAEQARELPTSERELFGEFGDAYSKRLAPGRAALQQIFGHEV